MHIVALIISLIVSIVSFFQSVLIVFLGGAASRIAEYVGDTEASAQSGMAGGAGALVFIAAILGFAGGIVTCCRKPAGWKILSAGAVLCLIAAIGIGYSDAFLYAGAYGISAFLGYLSIKPKDREPASPTSKSSEEKKVVVNEEFIGEKGPVNNPEEKKTALTLDIPENAKNIVQNMHDANEPEEKIALYTGLSKEQIYAVIQEKNEAAAREALSVQPAQSDAKISLQEIVLPEEEEKGAVSSSSAEKTVVPEKKKPVNSSIVLIIGGVAIAGLLFLIFSSDKKTAQKNVQQQPVQQVVQQAPVYRTTKEAFLTGTSVNYRTGPALDASVIATLKGNERLGVVEKTTDGKWTRALVWVKGSERDGWIYSKYVGYPKYSDNWMARKTMERALSSFGKNEKEVMKILGKPQKREEYRGSPESSDIPFSIFYYPGLKLYVTPGAVLFLSTSKYKVFPELPIGSSAKKLREKMGIPSVLRQKKNVEEWIYSDMNDPSLVEDGAEAADEYQATFYVEGGKITGIDVEYWWP